MEKEKFQDKIYASYREHGRPFPWRETRDPYKIVVSEIMLQQTQTFRVEKKYTAFIERFPDFKTLAGTSLQELYRYWQGLGYNKRALALREIAKTVIEEYQGRVPSDPDVLKKLPMVGSATSCSIVTFAYNIPTIFVEVNIRRVFLHEFLQGAENVSDRDIFPLVEETLDRKNPRDWYYALMDYGVLLKRLYPDPVKRSRHYAKQKPFEGSNRQIRGRILHCAARNSGFNIKEIYAELAGAEGASAEGKERELQGRIIAAAAELVREGFLIREGDRYRMRG